MDHRSLLNFTIAVILLLQLQVQLTSPEQGWRSASGWFDRQTRHLSDRRRLAADLAMLAVLR